MTLLTNTQKSKIQFHVNLWNQGTLDIKYQLSLDYDSDTIAYLNTILTRCDNALTKSELEAGAITLREETNLEQDIVVHSVTVSSKGTTTTDTTYGDKNTKKYKKASYSQRMSAYYKEVDLLTSMLGIEK